MQRQMREAGPKRQVFHHFAVTPEETPMPDGLRITGGTQIPA